MKKLILLLMLVLTTLLVACQAASALPAAGPEGEVSQSIEQAVTGVPPQPSTAVEEGAFPLTIRDDTGREVTLAAAPQRIVSLAPSNTEILFALGAGDAVVGVTNYCDFPAAAARLPQIGGFTANTISIEVILSLNPDLVLANGKDHLTIVAALQQENIPAIVLEPETYDDIFANIELVGQVTGHEEEAARLLEDMKARQAVVMEKVASVGQEDRPKVFWEVFDEPLMTAGPNSFIGQVIERAGGKNIFADLEETYPEISAEEIVKRNPEVILGPDSHGDKLLPELLAARPGWEQIDAVKNKRIYLLDANIASREGPRIVDALELTARALYPELFK
jgi:iron complex transport system substrate-binding protein